MAKLNKQNLINWFYLQKEGILGGGFIAGIIHYTNPWNVATWLSTGYALPAYPTLGSAAFFIFVGASIGAIVDSIYEPRK